jgi:hypothetical protein
MPQCHIFRTIADWPQSFALVSDSHAETAVMFVHGFNGSTKTTFSDFQGLISSHDTAKWWAGSDLYFFAYSSVTNHITTSSERFRDFLALLFPDPPRYLFQYTRKQYPWLQLNNDEYFTQWPRHYRRLVLVGHSEGAVVIRSTIRDLAEKVIRTKSDDLQSTVNPVFHATLKMFAPATSGANPSGLWALLLHFPFLGVFGRTFLQWSKAAKELTNPSPLALLVTLKNATEQYSNAYKLLNAFQAEVVFGDDDDVVTVNKWECDQKLDNMHGHTHTSICKPKKKISYFFPIEFVSKARP